MAIGAMENTLNSREMRENAVLVPKNLIIDFYATYILKSLSVMTQIRSRLEQILQECFCGYVVYFLSLRTGQFDIALGTKLGRQKK